VISGARPDLIEASAVARARQLRQAKTPADQEAQSRLISPESQTKLQALNSSRSFMGLSVLLTVKLRGRTTTCPGRRGPAISTGSRGAPVRPIRRRGRTLSSRARGARPQSHHGPLQRLLDGSRMPTHRRKRYQRQLPSGRIWGSRPQPLSQRIQGPRGAARTAAGPC